MTSVSMRLPLADAVLMVLSHVLEPTFLQSLFDAHRGRSYEKTLTFSALVRLIADALLEHAGSERKSFRAAREREAMPVSDPAGYGKLRRIPVALSVAFLSRTTERLGGLFPTDTASPLPGSLRGFNVFAHDGKKIKKVAKRLKPVRGVQGTPLGGKALVALWLNRGIAVALSAHPDGETNDGPLVPELLDQVRGRLQVPQQSRGDRRVARSSWVGQSDFVLSSSCAQGREEVGVTPAAAPMRISGRPVT